MFRHSRHIERAASAAKPFINVLYWRIKQVTGGVLFRISLHMLSVELGMRFALTGRRLKTSKRWGCEFAYYTNVFKSPISCLLAMHYSIVVARRAAFTSKAYVGYLAFYSTPRLVIISREVQRSHSPTQRGLNRRNWRKKWRTKRNIWQVSGRGAAAGRRPPSLRQLSIFRSAT